MLTNRDTFNILTFENPDSNLIGAMQCNKANQRQRASLDSILTW